MKVIDTPFAGPVTMGAPVCLAAMTDAMRSLWESRQPEAFMYMCEVPQRRSGTRRGKRYAFTAMIPHPVVKLLKAYI